MFRPAKTRIRVYMEQVLEQTCRSLPHGGDHDLRAFIAERLNDAAFAGRSTLGELGIIARKALADYLGGNPRTVTPHRAGQHHGPDRCVLFYYPPSPDAKNSATPVFLYGRPDKSSLNSWSPTRAAFQRKCSDVEGRHLRDLV